MTSSKLLHTTINTCILVCMIVIIDASVIPISDDSRQQPERNSTMNGNLLLRLGQLYNKPLFKILGKSVVELEKLINVNIAQVTQVQDEVCQMHACAEWSEWSHCCGNHAGDFNITSRTRQCGMNTTQCTFAMDSYKNETEYQLCEVTINCPGAYTVTKNGFCLKYYSTTTSNADADSTCVDSDGGHLVNINSKEKSDNVISLLQSSGVTSTIWIDGIRADLSSPWTFRHGSAPTSFSNWKSTEPSNGTTELCKVLQQSSSKWYWFDRSCGSTYGFICELM